MVGQKFVDFEKLLSVRGEPVASFDVKGEYDDSSTYHLIKSAG